MVFALFHLNEIFEILGSLRLIEFFSGDPLAQLPGKHNRVVDRVLIVGLLNFQRALEGFDNLLVEPTIERAGDKPPGNKEQSQIGQQR